MERDDGGAADTAPRPSGDAEGRRSGARLGGPVSGGRAGLAVTGLALLALGALPLGIGLGLFGVRAAGQSPMNTPVARFLNGNPEMWTVVAVVSMGVALLGASWLLSLGQHAVRRHRAAVDGATRMAARAAGRDLNDALRRIPGVQDVQIKLTGSLARPRAVLVLTCAEDADLVRVRTAAAAEPLTRYRRAMSLPELVAVLRFRLTPTPPPVPVQIGE